MSSQNIPNLLEGLRAAKASRIERSRARLGGGAGVHAASPDQVVQRTDDDAAGSRLSAVDLGYLDDPFAAAFSSGPGAPRRMPIINRGTYVRTSALDSLVSAFLEAHASNECIQVISLGAGTDTRFFRLVTQQPALLGRLRYHEFDFPNTTAKKIAALERHPHLMRILNSGASSGNLGPVMSENKDSMHTESYHLHAHDLRNLTTLNTSQVNGMDVSAPTLILSEMCLTYLQPHQSTALLEHLLATWVPPPAHVQILLYEPLNPHDAFGRTMTANLGARGINLHGMEAFPSLEAHKARLEKCGFTTAQEGWTQKGWWDIRITSEEKDRLRQCEMVDEEEEWILLASHYGLIRATR